MSDSDDNATSYRPNGKASADTAASTCGAFSITAMEGYVKLHRRLIGWEWFTDSTTLHVMVYLMCSVNWKDKRWRGIDIPAGSIMTSRGSISIACGLSEKQVRRALELLEQGRVISRSRAGTGQLVTLVKWEEYQLDDVEQGRVMAESRAEAGNAAGPGQGRVRAVTKEGKKERRKEDNEGRKRPRTQFWTIDQFKEECRKAVDADPERLPNSQHKPFFDYWTEGDGSGKMRFQAEKFFDVARRMGTWKRIDAASTPFAAKSNGAMTKEKALEWIEAYKQRLGIKPGDAIPTAEIPNDIYHAWRGYAKS